MNKKELIEKYEYLNHDCFRRVDTSEILKDLKQLDESKKVVVPQFVADWIEVCKKKGDLSLGGAIQLSCPEMYEWLMDWNNQEIFARAWLDGYEVEKEPKYKVKVKNTDDYLNETEVGFNFFNNSKKNKTFTRKELEYSDFAWVLDCPGIELEEVE